MKLAMLPNKPNGAGVWKAYYKGRVVASSVSRREVIRIATLRGFTIKEENA